MMDMRSKIESANDVKENDPSGLLTNLIKPALAPKRNQKGNLLTKCFCPKCETYHFLQMRWIGRGKPRKYCQRCKSQLFSRRFVDYSLVSELLE